MQLPKQFTNKLAIILLLFSGLFLYALNKYWNQLSWIKYLYLHGCMALVFVTAFALFELNPSILGKTEFGSIPKWSYIAFWPFHIFVNMNIFVLDRLIRKKWEAECDEVYDGWFLGGIFSHYDIEKKFNKQRIHLVIDMTNEQPRLPLRDVEAYLNLPTWDGMNPSLIDLKRGTDFVKQHMPTGKEKKILIHCCYGRGRSTTMLVCCLTALGIYPTWEKAFEEVKKRRPNAKLNNHMKRALTEFFKNQ